MKYFAYGSNLLWSRIVRRCPSVQILHLDSIERYSLAFNKAGVDGTAKANIIPGTLSVMGMVYSIPSISDIEILDGAEGEGREYDRIQIITVSGEICETYVALKTKENILPTAAYKNMVVTGMINHAFPEWYINEVRKIKTCEEGRNGWK